MSAAESDAEHTAADEHAASPASPAAAGVEPENPRASPRPLMMYTIAQLLALAKSPLITLPQDMPELKDWFGVENEQNMTKKDHDATPPTSARERRFRRDVEDGETSARPSYRTALQTSQMGNFKHQSLRDRDGDKDRDLRDKEGQERLRNLSDKFDRDRLALPLSMRNKDREAGTTRASAANQTNGTATRRTEPRENGKKKVEAADDWRRGGEARRGEDRERPRSRSRTRRDPSSKRDDRRDRDDTRRDRDADGDDARRWRDDGRRDERVAARRDREHKERWPAGDDKDTRTKRPAAREKKSEDDRNAAERRADREKEKEPAWMDTYVPSPAATGILGGKSAEGELDGIQAWKKGMKEKEQRATAAEASEAPPKPASDKPLDEIQMFKMMMKRDQEQKKDDVESTPASAPKSAGPLLTKEVNQAPTPTSGEASAPSVMSVFGLNERAKPAQDSSGISSPLHQLSLNDSEPTPSAGSFNPPQGPRLLALGRAPAKPVQQAPAAQPSSSNANVIKRPPPQLNLSGGLPPLDNTTDGGNFSPFDEHREATRYPLPQARSAVPSESNWNDVMDPGMGKGSRFAKFFDGKPKDSPVPKMQAPSVISPPISAPRPEQHIGYQQTERERSVDDIFAMINSSTQHRAPPSHPPSTAPSITSNHLAQQQMQSQLHLLQQQHQQQQQQQQQQQSHLHHLQQSNHRVDTLYDNRLDNRTFMPDNMVPGLRSAPPPRNRDNGGMYSDPLDEVIHLNSQRPPPPPLHRGIDPIYSAGIPPYGSQQPGRGAGIPVQHFRGAPSPIGNQNGLGQRIPPGLANLGVRPPHDPSQFSGIPGMNSAALHGGPINSQQSYNNYSSMGPGYNNGPPRGLPPPQLSGNLAQQQHQLAGLGHQTLMEMRNHNVNHGNMLNVGAPLNPGRNMGGGGGFPGHGQPSLHGMRQPAQQHPQIPSHHGMMPPPQHMPQDANSANLMALLLGRRD